CRDGRFRPTRRHASHGCQQTANSRQLMSRNPSHAGITERRLLLILLRVITADEAYSGLRPDILMLIAGMIVLGIGLEQSGLASAATDALVGSLDSFHPLVALIVLYGATLFATELLSNATVAVLITPLAVAL